MQRMTIDSATIRLMETILGEVAPDLEETLKALAANIALLSAFLFLLSFPNRREATVRAPAWPRALTMVGCAPTRFTDKQC